MPCSHCEWYKHPKLCKYSKKQPRLVPSQKLLDELNTSLRQSQKVIQQLFPNADLNQLGELPRCELVELINSAPAQTSVSGESTSPRTDSDNSGSVHLKTEDSGKHLEALEQEYIPYTTWNESKTGPNGIPPISDDVNALSMNVHRQSSYLGVSSIAAALRVISKINKALEQVILTSPPRTAQATRGNSPRRTFSSDDAFTTISHPTLSESQMVDAYFNQVHPLIPMIDETRFRIRFSAGERRDHSWLALLYMVFALGTIAGSTAEDNSHLIYYNKAKSCIDLDMFGNGHIETLQALGLMGGLYLHYESRPNMANAIMGAAMRMACALGLHREYPDGPAESRPDFVKKALLIPREVRRRTWWSLFCMDTWATTTQGRPSLGRISPAVSVLPPSYLGTPPNQSRPGSIADDDAFVMIICYEVAFCKIATRIQDRLAETPLLPPEETNRFDAELQHWRNSLPPMFHASADCPRRAQVPRAVMSWRFHNLRLVLHRPLLLNNALRSSLDQNDSSSEDEIASVTTCRQIAVDTIRDISNQWKETQISGWNAVWLLFQASMVPLVTIFAEFNRGNLHLVQEAQDQIETAIDLLGQMAQWSITARKTRNFMIKIYNHSHWMLNQATTLQSPSEHLPVVHEQTHAMSMPLSIDTTLAQASFSGPDPSLHAFYPHPGALLPSNGGLSQDMSVAIPTSMSGDGSLGTNYHQQIQQQHQDLGGETGKFHRGPHTTFMTQDELNIFWQQVLWGEGDMPEYMMDTGIDYDFVPASGGGQEWQ